MRSSLRRSIAVLSVATVTSAVALVAVGTPAAFAVTPPRPIVTGWMPYWSTSTSLADIKNNSDLFTEVSPFWYSSKSATSIAANISTATAASATSQIHALGHKVVPTVTDGTGAHHMAAILTNSSTRAQQVSALLTLVTSHGYDGVDLDYEDFAFSDGSSSWATTRVYWDAFVRSLGTALHAKGKMLTVSVPPTYNSARTTGSGYWVYDYAAIAPYVDRVRVMAYDYSSSKPGPIAPLAWTTDIVKYAITQMPAWKLEIGVPTYGYDWLVSTTGTCPTDNGPTSRSAVTAAAAVALASSLKLTPAWNSTYAERTFTYSKSYSGTTSGGVATSCTAKRTVWYDDAAAVVARAHLAGTYQLGGIATWTIGDEDQHQWASLRSYARTIAPRPATLELFATSSATYLTAERVEGRLIVAGAGVPNARVNLWETPAGSAKARFVTSGLTNASGEVIFSIANSYNFKLQLASGATYGYTLARSAIETTTVRPAVATTATHTVRVGGYAHFLTHVKPAVKGSAMSVQQYTSRGWVTVASGREASGGAMFVMVRQSTRGNHLFRVVVAAPSSRMGYGVGNEVWVNVVV